MLFNFPNEISGLGHLGSYPRGFWVWDGKMVGIEEEGVSESGGGKGGVQS